ncbi:sensor histidine kinase [Nocardia cyriacigeorgica]|uniref:sensor histidine kinase n=1 Tax=Nocardia cyriacigeorgica TaxID=135487 RepID=UPI002457F88A|nr:sensor histidine kinase [Nocardia cyriacigeorgica]
MRRRKLSLAAQLFLLQLVLLVLVIGLGAIAAIADARGDSDRTATREVSAVAVGLAAAPSTSAAVRSADPTALLQPVTESVRQTTGMDFIVVMAPDRTRFTHTDPARIGQPFSGTIDRALAGEVFAETFTGTLGPSIRAVAPVYAEGRVVALVSAGVTRARIGEHFAAQLPAIAVVSVAGLVVAAGGSLLVSRRLRRQTHGMAPAELRALYEQHDAVLRSIHEGLLVFGRGGGEADVVNDEARRLLDLPDGPVVRSQLPVSLRGLGESMVRDETHVAGDRVLLVNQDVVRWRGDPIGTVLTVRDHTELRAVLGELESIRGFAEALRAQAHESANRLHTVVTMVELGKHREAVAFATAELELSQALIDRLLSAVSDPVLAALLLGKVNRAAERGVELTISEDTALASTAPLSAHEAVTVVGNLIDNAIDAAAAERDGWVEVAVCHRDSALRVRVADSGPGMSPELFARAAERGYSTKTDHYGLGLALVHRVVVQYGGTVGTETAPEGAVTVVLPLEERP